MSNEETLVTLDEVVQDKIHDEEEAIAVLGASDENNCSYPLGYVDRQALYSCLTCNIFKDKPAGVCLACSLHCHANHELVELYTKRDFRCDCGNSKFEEKCKLIEDKDTLNGKNSYNHNFDGIYCTCARPYPDPDDEVEDEMVQCMLCEDWYHTRHLGDLPPASYCELTCDKCTKKCSFLQYYSHLTVEPPVTVVKEAEDTTVDVEGENKSTDINQLPKAGDKRKAENIPSSSSLCKLKGLQTDCNATPDEELKVIYWKQGWRKELCKCDQCLSLYDKLKVPFLISEADMVASYEKKGKENVEKLWDDAADQISSMNRMQQVELMHGFNALKEGLQDFFSEVSRNNDGIITKEAVDSFFKDLNERKRARLDTGHGLPPDGCR